MMQIVHALRTGAETMAFGEITEVVPWDVLAHDCGQDLSAPQVAVPRAFKSHATWPSICKGGRYLYVARDPVDAFYSFYKFLPAYINLQPGDITQEQFADAIFAGVSHSGQIWDHFLGWWEQRHNPDVMWLFYEDLKDDLPGEWGCT
jgi:aryl sulfotransferase